MTTIFIFLMWVHGAFANFERVENGTTVAASQAISRSVAMIKYSNGGTCSASFISKKFLVTAGHCTHKMSAAQLRIHVRDSKGQWHAVAVKRLITHPSYRLSESYSGTRVQHDIALIELSNEFSFAVRPMRIGNVNGMKLKPSDVTVAGYGRNAPNVGSGILRTGTMRALVEKLSNFYDREGLYMVPKTNQSVCQGDSGGAVIRGNSSSLELIGVNSLSSACQGSSSPESMSEIVPNYRPWIRQYVPGV